VSASTLGNIQRKQNRAFTRLIVTNQHAFSTLEIQLERVKFPEVP